MVGVKDLFEEEVNFIGEQYFCWSSFNYIEIGLYWQKIRILCHIVHMRCWTFLFHRNHKAGYTLIAKYVKIIRKCKKRKVYSEVFRVTFFVFRDPFSLFTFHSILHQGRHSREKSKDFVVYFFAASIKHKIHTKYEKCMLSVSYFVVCVSWKHLRNMKYGKCIASQTSECNQHTVCCIFRIGERYCWLQQDGAMAHTTSSTMPFLKKFFGDHIISRPLWHPHSPDLTPPDFEVKFLTSRWWVKWFHSRHESVSQTNSYY